MNILIASCGRRNKIVQYFKKELKNEGKVFVADCSELAPALYDADEYFIVPKITDPNYIDELLSICKQKNVQAIFTLIDPEISLLAENRNRFLEIGTIPITSELDAVNMSFDKYLLYQFLLEYGFNTIKSYIDKEDFYEALNKGEIFFPVFVKPRTGSASINIHKIDSKEEIELLFSQFDDLMIQQFMDGTEIGADVYIDLISNEVVSIFTKEKITMRAGETDKSVSIKDEKLFSLIGKFVEKAGFQGMIDIDLFKVDGEYYISEVNPRFGGGYPHAYECGVNFPKLLINNLNNQENEKAIGEYEEGIQMMKYQDIKIVKQKAKVSER